MRYIFFALALCFFSTGLKAEPIADIKELIQEKTFWSEQLPERYYFGKDGLLLMQYMSTVEQHEAGTVREGTWVIGENNRLCWTFKDEGINRCYDVSEDLLTDRPWYNYDNIYELQEAGRPANILWNRWMYGNLITKPEIYKAVSEGKAPPLDAEAYKAAISDRVMRLPLGYMYYRSNGSSFLVDEKIAKSIMRRKEDADEFAAQNHQVSPEAKWSVQDSRFCNQWPDGRRSCVTVFSAQDLYVPQEGWVQIMDDNFIRLIKPSDLIAVK